MVNYVYQLTSPRVISIKYENLNLDDKVVIKPLYMAIGHADQRYYTATRDKKVLSQKLPMALIHEFCGEVVIDKSGKFKKGQKVVLIPNVPGKYNNEIYENYGEGAKFLSSGYDGFMREYINLSSDRIVSFDNIPLEIATITEFISVSIHAIERFKNVSHSNKDTIGVWGDGSLAFVTANVLKKEFPNSQIIVFGKNRDKLSLFSFIDKTILIDNIPQDLKIDHAFECVGGEGSFYAIDDIIRCIKPQGTILLMGVSENRIGINTRDILEKGLTFVGSSRSSYQDFVRAVEILQDEKVQKRLKLIIENYGVVKKIEDIHKVFNFDLNTPFKTVFRWEI